MNAEWWSRIGPVKRALLVIVGLALGVNVVLAALGSVVGGDPGGPTGSSFATGEDGVAAWSELLSARGASVSARRADLGSTPPLGRGTVVVSDPARPLGIEALTALAGHLEGGGRVVLVGANATDAVTAFTGVDVGWVGEGSSEVEVVTDDPAFDGVTEIRGEGRGAFLGADGLDEIATGADGRAVIVGAGSGAAGPSLIAVADSTILWNRHLAEADNAALAVALGGDGPVTFAEAEHGYGEASGLQALPSRWRLAAVALAVAALVGMWSVGQRFGPPDEIDRPLPPRRADYIDALVAGMARSPRHRSGGPPGVGDSPPVDPALVAVTAAVTATRTATATATLDPPDRRSE